MAVVSRAFVGAGYRMMALRVSELQGCFGSSVPCVPAGPPTAFTFNSRARGCSLGGCGLSSRADF